MSQSVTITNIKSCEVENERTLIIQAKINNSSFVNVYANNHGADHMRMFQRIKREIKQYNKDSVLIVGRLDLYY